MTEHEDFTRYAPRETTPDQIVRGLIASTDSPHLVVGPLVWRPSDGTRARVWHFDIFSSEAGHGCRADIVHVEADTEQEAVAARAEILGAFARSRPPLAVHDVKSSEIDAVRLSEELWPGEQISGLRAAVEADLAATAAERRAAARERAVASIGALADRIATSPDLRDEFADTLRRQANARAARSLAGLDTELPPADDPIADLMITWRARGLWA
ncbi:MAG: hypothetical protein HXX10_05740 [Rhodoplanes sp.]|uniref:hypothetical protein n=1 Tax=Rhodoplanes sp. TaxID=1968906 RepID=UPI0017F4AA96|nr:hypothetical protein [Rhodoplanes sp.]NVO13522.1 hypothetical protein [Rhodoplanes sp.]